MRKSLGLTWDSETLQLHILDQTLLPHEEKWIEIKSVDQMVHEIKRLAVRGAPLLGVAAACALASFTRNIEQLKTEAKKLRESRPTAVNLGNAIDRVLAYLKQTGFEEGEDFLREIVDEAGQIFDQDVDLCLELAAQGMKVAKPMIEQSSKPLNILTHCNAGGLATAGIGTAIGVIQKAHEYACSIGKSIHVYVDETRPLLQGARLTAWEMKKLGIPHTLICDNMAGSLMAAGKVDLIFVGSDRIAANYDFANKIGTYPLAVLAHHHKIPFYAVAPRTTFDPHCPDGSKIVIEERDPYEVRAGKAPNEVMVFNPAFDVTPRSLFAHGLGGVILEDGIF